MLYASGVFMLEALLFYALRRRALNKAGKKKMDESRLEFGASRIFGLAAGSLLLFLLALTKAVYFRSLDDIVGCMYIFAAVTLLGIAASCAAFLLNQKASALKMHLLRTVDDFASVFAFVLAAAVLGHQIPAADMGKFFGAGVSRFAVINLPFILCLAFMLASNICLVLQTFLSRLDNIRIRIINDFTGIFLFIVVSVAACVHFSLPLNIAGVLSAGVIASYILQAFPEYLGRARPSAKPLGLLAGLSKVLGITSFDILMLCAVIAISLAWGGFYGLGLACIGMVSGTMFSSATCAFYERSDAFRHISRAIDNMVLFAIFCETLEVMLNRKVQVDIFSSNVVLGLSLGVMLIVANIRKIILIARSVLVERKRKYAVAQGLVYSGAIVAVVSVALPFANFELLSAFVLGVAAISPLVSLTLLNVAGVGSRKGGWTDLLVLLNSQIATFVIAATILLLPLVK
jgi:hypothetical protein